MGGRGGRGKGKMGRGGGGKGKVEGGGVRGKDGGQKGRNRVCGWRERKSAYTIRLARSSTDRLN